MRAEFRKRISAKTARRNAFQSDFGGQSSDTLRRRAQRGARNKARCRVILLRAKLNKKVSVKTSVSRLANFVKIRVFRGKNA